MTELNTVLAELNQASQTLTGDLGKLARGKVEADAKQSAKR